VKLSESSTSATGVVLGVGVELGVVLADGVSDVVEEGEAEGA
jgi:hypothetical protein